RLLARGGRAHGRVGATVRYITTRIRSRQSVRNNIKSPYHASELARQAGFTFRPCTRRVRPAGAAPPTSTGTPSLRPPRCSPPAMSPPPGTHPIALPPNVSELVPRPPT